MATATAYQITETPGGKRLIQHDVDTAEFTTWPRRFRHVDGDDGVTFVVYEDGEATVLFQYDDCRSEWPGKHTLASMEQAVREGRMIELAPHDDPKAKELPPLYMGGQARDGGDVRQSAGAFTAGFVTGAILMAVVLGCAAVGYIRL